MAKIKTSIKNTLDGIKWDEFNPENPDYRSLLRKGLEFTRTEIDTPQLRQATITWTKINDPKNQAGLELVPDWRFLHIGKYYWLINNGAILTDDTMGWLLDNSQEVFNKAKQLTKQKEINQKENPKPVGPTTEQLGFQLAQALEELILNNTLLSDENLPYEVLANANPQPTVLKSAVDHLRGFAAEHRSMNDEEIEEGFRNRRRWQQSINLLNELIGAAGTYGQNTKRKRKARKPRRVFGAAKRLQRAVEKVTIKKEDTNLRVVSADPSTVIGAHAVLVYNTKYRKLGIYHAKDNNGLQIRGTTIHNFNEEASTCKNLRKPEEQLESFRRVELRRAEIVFRDYIRAKAKPMTGRLNEHTLIVHVWQ